MRVRIAYRCLPEAKTATISRRFSDQSNWPNGLLDEVERCGESQQLRRRERPLQCCVEAGFVGVAFEDVFHLGADSIRLASPELRCLPVDGPRISRSLASADDLGIIDPSSKQAKCGELLKRDLLVDLPSRVSRQIAYSTHHCGM